ncbi:MAG: hypothetical protein CFE24_09280 [Flavobacterium sp. BFFFF2]|nr:MAG: hypothetical protein CFE24_09280 [Flavobacterium sp. BFFFF2]
MTFYAGQKGPFFWFVFFGPAKKMNKGLSTVLGQLENKRYYEYHIMLTHEPSREINTMMMRFSFAELTFLLRRNDKIRFSINVYFSAKLHRCGPHM